jgi:hypothetical protein
LGRSILQYMRRHHLALLALFVALGGTSLAATNALVPRNSVASPQVVNGSLLRADLSKKTVRALRGKRGLRGLRGQTGATGPQGPATGPAGGDLIGNYPSPTIKSGAIRASKLGPIITIAQSASVPQNSNGSALADCPEGSVLLSGGIFPGHNGDVVVVTKAQRNGWRADIRADGVDSTVTAYAYCLTG